MEKHVRLDLRAQLLTVLVILLSSRATAQIGTITQDISTLQDFSLQPQCVQSCFQMYEEFCPLDMLGAALGCASMACGQKSWQAKNDCYCRLDFQEPAQEYLDGCIKTSCSVGNPSVAVASAGSIYRRYCNEKGYDTTAPASNEASTTDTAKAATSTRARTSPTSTSTSPSTSTSSGNEENSAPAADSHAGMSTATLVGIIIGVVVGTLLLTFAAFRLYKRNQARQHRLTEEKLRRRDLGPDDSVTSVGSPHPPLPPDYSLVSGGQGTSAVTQPHLGRRQ